MFKGVIVMVSIGQTVYYARFCTKANIKQVLRLRVQSVSGNYFTAMDESTKESYPFFMQQLHNDVFYEENTARQILKHKIKEEKIKNENRNPIYKVDMLPGQTDLFDYI